VSSTIAVSVNVPSKSGCSDTEVIALKFCTPVTLDTIAVALELKLPSLSTALIK